MSKTKDQTYDFICFSDLAYEFDFSKKKDIEKKIKRRLKYHKLRAYDQERVDYIRQLKNDLYAEITQFSKSKYYRKSQSTYTDLADFDTQRMTVDFQKTFGLIDKNELMDMINFAVYLFHTR